MGQMKDIALLYSKTMTSVSCENWCCWALLNKESHRLFGTKYSRIDQVKFVEDSL